MKRTIVALMLCLLCLLTGCARNEKTPTLPMPEDAVPAFDVPKILSVEAGTVTYAGAWTPETMKEGIGVYLTALEEAGYVLTGTENLPVWDIRAKDEDLELCVYSLQGQDDALGTLADEPCQIRIEMLIRSHAIHGWTGGRPMPTHDEIVITCVPALFEALTAHLDEKVDGSEALSTPQDLYPELERKRSDKGMEYTGFSETRNVYTVAAEYVTELERFGYRLGHFDVTNGSGSYYLTIPEEKRGEEQWPEVIKLQLSDWEEQVLTVFHDPEEQETVQRWKCETCDGRGTVLCSHCKGKGYLVRSKDGEKIKQNCTRCHDDGRVSCSDCGGDGRK